MATVLKLIWIALIFSVLLAGCGDTTTVPASDPPGALVRLERNDAATTLPGDLTIFSNGALQLYLGDRGALRKTVAPAELADLQAALTTPALAGLADSYPTPLPAGAGDTLTIYGARRRSIRYDPGSPDLPPALLRLIAEITNLRRRF